MLMKPFVLKKKKKKSEKSKFILRIQIYFPTFKIMKYVVVGGDGNILAGGGWWWHSLV